MGEFSVPQYLIFLSQELTPSRSAGEILTSPLNTALLQMISAASSTRFLLDEIEGAFLSCEESSLMAKLSCLPKREAQMQLEGAVLRAVQQLTGSSMAAIEVE